MATASIRSAVCTGRRFFSYIANSSHNNTHKNTHKFLEHNSFIGSWKAPKNPKEAEAKLTRLRRVYAKQVKEVRKEYIREMELMRIEKQRQDEARKDAIRVANEERKKLKAEVAKARAEERKIAEEEFCQMLCSLQRFGSFSLLFWQLARPSQAVSCPMGLTSVNLYRGPGQGGPRCRTGLELPSRDNVVSEQGPKRSESCQAPQRDQGRQGVDGDKGVAGIGWGRMSGLNGTEVDKGFSIPHRTRKGSIRGTSVAYQQLVFALGERNNWCVDAYVRGSVTKVAQGSDANARKRGRLRDWVGEIVTVRKFLIPILGSWQGRHKLSLALWS
ncbi:hypothetical protein GH714_034242 [Hevea brasiliensis]|uniref:Uncharacterized protein n=1 Tax=Hevea brasiliensis TaxID=3981 RepID=A0A6A6NA79_HEVBR|nr:hypothetical protein GH714_034242 [Hevea brasiliensis]